MKSTHLISGLVAGAILATTAHGQGAGGGPMETPAPTNAAAASMPTIGLKDAFAGKYLIGTASDLRGYSDLERANIKANYNIITPENCMKPQPIHPSENTYNWTTPDALVQWCQDNNIKVWGHNLCWHSQTGNWFFQPGTNGEAVTRDLVMARFKSHISTVVGRYKGRVIGWDVVNEAINDGGNGQTENLRNDNWFRQLGPDYLTMAFKWAHEADPDALLFYNDYNIEQGAVAKNGKHASSMLLLQRLIKDGAPINGVGIQGHWHLDTSLADVEQAITDYESLGLKVAISELDVTVSGGNSGAFPGGGGGGGAAVAPEAFQRQAEMYAKLFEIFNRHAKNISRVTLWGISDRRSWRSGQQPLVFDGQLKPKPAFQAIVDVGLGKNPAN
jgi:endo-1,4-beta-xylanase